MVVQGQSDVVHDLDRQPSLGRLSEQLEDTWTTMFPGEITHTRHDVEVHMGEALHLGELSNLGLGAAGYLAQGLGQPQLPRSQPCGLGIGELVNGSDMAAGQEYQPSGKQRVEGVGYTPVLIHGDPFP